MIYLTANIIPSDYKAMKILYSAPKKELEVHLKM